jgi:hypothetical protein
MLMKRNPMVQKEINRFCFLGEVYEIFHQDGQRWMRTICKPGKILIQIPEDHELNLGDTVKVTCTLKVKKLEKQTNS